MDETYRRSIAVLGHPLDALPDPLPIPVWRRRAGAAPVDVTLRPPGSKSLTNRVLLLAALCDGASTVGGALLEADDAERMLAAVQTLGARVERLDEPEGAPGPRLPPTGLSAPLIRVTGVGGRWRVPEGGARVDLHNAGTATRFLAAASLLAAGPVTIDGNERMRARPIGELADALTGLGADVDFLADPGCPPIRVTPPPENLPAAGVVELGRTQSSQFISGLLLAGVFLPGGLTLKLTGDEVTSGSYVRMTTDLLDLLGARVRTSADLRVIRVGDGLEPFDIEIEPDASGATYWFAAGVLLPEARVRVDGLVPDAGVPVLQGDVAFPDTLARLGGTVVEKGRTLGVRGQAELGPVMADMRDMPDAAVTLAVCCAFAQGTSVLRGVRTLRVKECDRIAALRAELGKLGVDVRDRVNGDDDVLTITPPPGGIDCSPAAPEIAFETYDDHRMAMALALVGLRRPNVLIRDPGCVAKTYPGYFAHLARLYG